MNCLAKVFIIKIAATLAFWCAPLIFFPASWIERLGVPPQETTLYLRLLGWAYLALCVGYAVGLREALHGRRAMGAIWMGIVSNGAACGVLLYFGFHGEWSDWGALMKYAMWSSTGATAAITAGLIAFGAMGREPEAV